MMKKPLVSCLSYWLHKRVKDRDIEYEKRHKQGRKEETIRQTT